MAHFRLQSINFDHMTRNRKCIPPWRLSACVLGKRLKSLNWSTILMTMCNLFLKKNLLFSITFLFLEVTWLTHSYIFREHLAWSFHLQRIVRKRSAPYLHKGQTRYSSKRYEETLFAINFSHGADCHALINVTVDIDTLQQFYTFLRTKNLNYLGTSLNKWPCLQAKHNQIKATAWMNFIKT